MWGFRPWPARKKLTTSGCDNDRQPEMKTDVLRPSLQFLVVIRCRNHFGYTFIELVIIENPEFILGISMLSVIVSEILVLLVIWLPSWISGTHRCPMTSAIITTEQRDPKM